MRWVVVLALVAACWKKPPTAPPMRDARLTLAGSTQVLANGVRVVVLPDAEAREVSVTMQYAVGTSDDPAAREGMAHLVEHLLFEPRLDGVPLHVQLQARAVAYNGTTTLDRTTYWSRGWASELEALLAIEATRLADRCATITDEDFARQRDIVAAEQRGRAGYAQVQTALTAGLYPRGHAHHRAAATTFASLEAITRAEACAFMTAHYRTEDAVLVVGGAVNPGTLPDVLARTVGRVERTATAYTAPPPAVQQPRSLARVPIRHRFVVLAWPLPAGLVERAQRQAILKMVAVLARQRIAGDVEVATLGAADAPLVGIVIEPIVGRSAGDMLDGYRQALFELDQWFGTGLYEAARARATYDLFAALEPGVVRDERLAEHARAGRDPLAASHAEVTAVHTLDRAGARALTAAFALDAATIVVLEAGGAGDTEPATGLRPPAHEAPAAPPTDATPASAPEPLPADAPARLDVRTRTLGNGLRVVLAPWGPPGAVDVRVVIPAGSAHDPRATRGIAQLAGHALTPASYDDVEMLRFVMAGGSIRVDVGAEATTFATSGIGANVDSLLMGLGIFVQRGDYEDLNPTVEQLRTASAYSMPHLLALLAWQRALYGATDPRIGAGLWRPSEAVSVDAVRRFRQLRYVPEGATIIVSGGFDVDVTDRWVETAFGDWRGKRLLAPLPAADFSPFAFAQPASGSSVQVRIAAPAPQRRDIALVVTELFDQVLGDVRRELGATYELGAMLDSAGTAPRILVGGDIHAARAAEAFALIRRRLDELATGADLDARFVLARRRVMNELLVIPAGHRARGAWAQEAIERGATVDTSLATATAVRTLGVAEVRAELARLRLDRLAIFLRGPTDAITTAFAQLGREPVVLDP